jgi:hypothetical protein
VPSNDNAHQLRAIRHAPAQTYASLAAPSEGAARAEFRAGPPRRLHARVRQRLSEISDGLILSMDARFNVLHSEQFPRSGMKARRELLDPRANLVPICVVRYEYLNPDGVKRPVWQMPLDQR